MDKMDKNSKPYLEGGYEDMFESAESDNIVAEDVVLYSQSLAHLRELQAGLDFRYEEGIRKGMEKGMEKGREEGKKEGALETAKRMKAAGIDVGFISKITDLSVEIIKSL